MSKKPPRRACLHPRTCKQERTMITIIAEKPSVAQEIARIVGARTRKDGYMEGNGYAVTWALGHLVEIYADGDDDWSVPLPLLPDAFRLRVARTRRKDGRLTPDPGYAKQLGIIKYLFHHSESVVNAGDAGREGELIQRYIYAYVNASVPVRRLWISSLTDEAIREGLRNLRPSSEFDDLYLAGKARSEADWLIGVNATRALTKAAGGEETPSLGRVQTPTLAMICRRFLENRDFDPVPFWTLHCGGSLGGDTFVARSARYEDYQSACIDRDKVAGGGRLVVMKVSRRTVSKEPPLLHDLTSLQREANGIHSMTAQETLTAAQSLYEKKLITYPRTGSRFITEDVFRTVPQLLARLSAFCPGLPFDTLEGTVLNRRSVCDGKVTDHHALLPTGLRPEVLSENERRVYSLVVTRLLESFSGKCEMMETSVELDGNGVAFSLKGRMVMTPGWTGVRKEKEPAREEDGEDVQEHLPPFHEGDVCRVENLDIPEGKTKPRPLYTDATLLEAMEHAGREVDDESLRDAIRECGLGTPATRAGEIETLVERGYVSRKGKTLVPTRTGLGVYEVVRDKSIANVSLTAGWERALSEIAEGRCDTRDFDRGIRMLAAEIVSEIGSHSDISKAIAGAGTVPGAKCPLCGKAVILTTRLVRCTNAGCHWQIWRTISGKTLSEREILSLLGTGKTMELKGFKSKAGKSFAARLRLDGEGRPAFEFVDHDKDAEGNALRCPRCGKPLRVYPNAVVCQDEACGWRLWREVAGKTVTEAMIPVLLSGKTTGAVKGFRSKTGKVFNAALRLNAAGGIEFVFDRKQSLAKKKSSW